jgi:ankyrin repeat protein
MTTRKNKKSNKIFIKTRTKKQRGGDINKKLLDAAKNKKLDEVREALATGANINAINNDGYTALIIASINGHTEIVAMLLYKGADVNMKDNGGKTALNLASDMHLTEIVTLLEAATNESQPEVESQPEEPEVESQYAPGSPDWDPGSPDWDPRIESQYTPGSPDWDPRIESQYTPGSPDWDPRIESQYAPGSPDYSPPTTPDWAPEESQYQKDKKLLDAAKNKKLDEVREALATGANVNVTDDDGNTALIIASEKGYTEIVEMLLKKGADVNATDKYGRTALIWASMQRRHQVVGMLEAAIANNTENNSSDEIPVNEVPVNEIPVNEAPESQDEKDTKLFKAVVDKINEDIEIRRKRKVEDDIQHEQEAARLLEEQEAAAALAEAARLEEEEQEAAAALAEAARLEEEATREAKLQMRLIRRKEDKIRREQEEKVINKALKNGANVNRSNDTGSTVLHIASFYGHEEIMKILLKQDGIDMNVVNNDGSTALMIAIAKDDKKITENHISTVKLLLDKGVDVNVVNKDGSTALTFAITEGHISIVKLLLDKGIDVNARYMGKLLNKRTDDLNVNANYKNGYTALLIASEKGHIIIVNMLLKRGADVEAKDKFGDTALIIASIKGKTEHIEIVGMLLDKKADVNVKNKRDKTALIAASGMGHTKIVKILLKKGADVNVVNKNGSTALQMAINNRHTDVVKLLEKFYKKPEENFIMDSIDKELTYYDEDAMEATITIKDYLQKDKDNIIFVYKSLKKDVDLDYFVTTRDYITEKYNDEHSVFYGCNKVITPPPFVPRKEDYNEKNVYLGLSTIGLVGPLFNYCDIQTFLDNEDHQLFAIKNLNTNYPSFVAKHVLGRDPNIVSASHCQGRDASNVSTLIKAYSKDFCTISNIKMLQETSEPRSKGGFGGKKKTKRKNKRKNKRKTKRNKKNKRK